MSSCCEKTKMRPEDEKRALINRLSRIEGQVRGIKAMIEEDKYCVDILTQASAVSSALGAFSREVLESHIRSCVIDGIKSGDNDKVDELITTIERFIR